MTVSPAVPREMEVGMSRGIAGFSGAAARRGRNAARLTADQLAVQLGVAEQTVLRWERGEARPTAEHLGSLAEALDVTTADLLPRRAAGNPTLRDLRHFSGLSIQAVAKRTELSPSGIVRLERGVSSLNPRTAVELATAYAVAVGEIEAAYEMTSERRLADANLRRRRTHK